MIPCCLLSYLLILVPGPVPLLHCHQLLWSTSHGRHVYNGYEKLFLEQPFFKSYPEAVKFIMLSYLNAKAYILSNKNRMYRNNISLAKQDSSNVRRNKI